MGLFKKKENLQEDTNEIHQSKNNTTSEDIPSNLKKHDMRVSTPYGMYPEDVNTVVTGLERKIEILSNEVTKLGAKLSTTISERDSIKAEFVSLRMQLSMMEFPTTSTQQDLQGISQINNITQPVDLMNDSEYVDDIINEEEPKPTQVFDNLVTNTKHSNKKFKL